MNSRSTGRAPLTPWVPMKSMFVSIRRWRAVTLTALSLAGIAGTVGVRAQEFVITGLSVDATGGVIIRHQADPNLYCVLRGGTDVTHIVSAVDLALGVPIEGQLSDLPAGETVAFYRGQQVPITSPLDTDGDGIDDVRGLRHRHPGAALNGLDANDDHNGKGIPDLTEYLRPMAYFDQGSSAVEKGSVSQVTVRFSRPYSGKILFKLDGTAQELFDYKLETGSQIEPKAPTLRSLQVSSTEATLRVDSMLGSLGEGNRQVLLSLVQPAGNAHWVGQPSVRVVTLKDSAIALYTKPPDDQARITLYCETQ